mmetsp:Transcript_26783/g.42050  ORF Transcript_26783/g.42050 Transcript_26783/m.42050 type:complete len:103 (+) Transcript_26783:386-694(+)
MVLPSPPQKNNNESLLLKVINAITSVVTGSTCRWQYISSSSGRVFFNMRKTSIDFDDFCQVRVQFLYQLTSLTQFVLRGIEGGGCMLVPLFNISYKLGIPPQ